MISESDLYRLQAHAIATGDQHLRHLTYTALGHDAKIAMMPTASDEKLRAQQSCADQLERLQTMGVVLRTRDEVTVDDLPIKLPVHVIDQTGQPYGSTRQCCNRCGAMTMHGMRYLASIEEWLALPKSWRCD